MLKKIMKAALAASLVFGMSSFAYAADVKVYGDAVEYFGQYDKGTKIYDATTGLSRGGYGANFMSIGEAHLKLSAKLGNMSLYHEMESKLGPATMYATTGGDIEKADYKNTQTRLTYSFHPLFNVTIGNVVNIGTVHQSSAGFKTTNVPGASSYALVTSGYSEYEGIQFQVNIPNVGIVQATVREGCFNYLVTGLATSIGDIGKAAGAAATATTSPLAKTRTQLGILANNAIVAGTSMGKTEGNMYNLGTQLMFGPLTLRLGYMTSATDDPNAKNEVNAKGTGMLVSAEFKPNKMLTFSTDIATGTISIDTGSVTNSSGTFTTTGLTAYDDIKIMSWNLGAEIQAGPGKVVARYESVDYKWDDPLLDKTVMHLLYDIAVAPGAGIDIGYASVNNEWDSSLKDLGTVFKDGTTQTYLAVGFYAYF